MELVLFYILSALSLVSAIAVLCCRNPIYSALSLVACMFGIAGHFALLDAHFLAVIQVVVYAGAIIVLVLFVTMLLNVNADLIAKSSKFLWIVGGATVMLLLARLLPWVVAQFDTDQAIIPMVQIEGTVQNLGFLLFGDYVLTFEIAGVLILAAMVGAIIVAEEQDSQNTLSQKEADNA